MRYTPCGVKPTGTEPQGPAHMHFAWETRDPQGTRRDPQGPAISIFLRLPRPTRVHPGPIFLGPSPTPRLGSKNLIHSDVGPMDSLFDHGPVFSAVVQIIFQTGWAIACGVIC